LKKLASREVNLSVHFGRLSSFQVIVNAHSNYKPLVKGGIADVADVEDESGGG
jgi:hypothetical protein